MKIQGWVQFAPFCLYKIKKQFCCIEHKIKLSDIFVRFETNIWSFPTEFSKCSWIQNFTKLSSGSGYVSCGRITDWHGETNIPVSWIEINQQDTTNLIFIIKLLSEHVSGITMPVISRTRTCITAYGVLHFLCLAVVVCSWVVSCVHCVKFTETFTQCTQLTTQLCTTTARHKKCRTPYAVIQVLFCWWWA